MGAWSMLKDTGICWTVKCVGPMLDVHTRCYVWAHWVWWTGTSDMLDGHNGSDGILGCWIDTWVYFLVANYDERHRDLLDRHRCMLDVHTGCDGWAHSCIEFGSELVIWDKNTGFRVGNNEHVWNWDMLCIAKDVFWKSRDIYLLNI